MMRHNHSIRFFLKTTAKAKSNGFPVYARLICNRQKAEFFIGEYCPALQWNKETGQPIKTPRLREFLVHIENEINEIKRSLDFEKKEVSSVILKDLFQRKHEEEASNLLPYIDAYIAKISLLTEDYTKGTVKHYHTTKQHLIQFLASKKLKDIALLQINLQFVEEWDFFLLTTKSEQYDKPMARNSANKYHTKLKTMLKAAQKEALIVKQPYENFKLKDKEVSICHLTKEELIAIENFPFEHGLEKAKDIFLFTCYTALRFSDAQALSQTEIIKDSEGNLD